MSAAIAATAVAVAMALGSGATDARLSDDQLVGQRLVVGFEGTQVPASVRRRIAAGELAGVILFDTNFSGDADAARLIGELQAIERPPEVDEPLLVMVDQEGGLVKRLPGPPDLSAAEMGAAGPDTCRDEGAATGRALRATGFNVDLAPVLDVGRPGSAIESEGRSFGNDPKQVSRCANAFAAALSAEGVAPTAKHFPGLGAAPVNTDEAVQRIDISAATLRRVDEQPYWPYVRGGGADRLVMLSSAIYSAFGERPAALTRELATDELRGRLGFRGVSITDALETATTNALGGPTEFARRAAEAGADLLLFTSAGAAADAVPSLHQQLRGPRSRERFAAAASRVLALRSGLAD
jgi:beta-N-acetylhexosaminidase